MTLRARHTCDLQAAHSGHADVEERNLRTMLSSASSALRPSSHSATISTQAKARLSSVRNSCRAELVFGNDCGRAQSCDRRLQRQNKSREHTAGAAPESSSDAADSEPRQQLSPNVREAGSLAHAELQTCSVVFHQHFELLALPSPQRRARQGYARHPGFGSTPCLIAFSTSEMSRNGGNGTSCSSGGSERPLATDRPCAPS